LAADPIFKHFAIDAAFSLDHDVAHGIHPLASSCQKRRTPRWGVRLFSALPGSNPGVPKLSLAEEEGFEPS
jgi:hypothetical protein